MDKKKYTLGALGLVIVISIGVFFILNKSSNKKLVTNNQESYSEQIDTSPTPSTNVPRTPSQVSFVETDINLGTGQERTSTLSFSPLPSPAPTAFTLVLAFDPSQIQINDIQPGNLWTGENILQKEIDNENGEVKFSVGQGFSDEVTGNSDVAKITFTKIGDQETEIIVAEGSAYASVEEKVLIPMQGLSLSISVN